MSVLYPITLHLMISRDNIHTHEVSILGPFWGHLLGSGWWSGSGGVRGPDLLSTGRGVDPRRGGFFDNIIAMCTLCALHYLCIPFGLPFGPIIGVHSGSLFGPILGPISGPLFGHLFGPDIPDPEILDMGILGIPVIPSWV